MSGAAAPSLARPIDHCVLPTADLATARGRFEALGFTVAPEGRHPFGTVNCCVYFSDDTFLEPLAIGDRAAIEKAIIDGNVFIMRDCAVRDARGEDTFSALVMGTSDAAADHRCFEEAGISAGQMLSFSRPFEDASGKRDKASFKLAFAAGEPGSAFFFTCQRVNAPKVDRAGLQNHANGVTGIARVVLVANDVPAHRDLITQVTRAHEIEDFVGGTDFKTANGLVCLLDPSGMKAMLGLAPKNGTGLDLAAIVFRVCSLEKVEERLANAGIAPMRHAGWLVVEPAPGQGAIFAFEAAE
jgi:hypothetical protein